MLMDHTAVGMRICPFPVRWEMHLTLPRVRLKKSELSEGSPENSNRLFPSNATGPDRLETAEENGCFVAKDQTMAHSMVFPFHYPNPVTGKYVTWKSH